METHLLEAHPKVTTVEPMGHLPTLIMVLVEAAVQTQLAQMEQVPLAVTVGQESQTAFLG